MDQPLLTLDGITKRFGGVTALKDVGFSVEKGEIVGLMGPNGAGKTTLLNAITGNIPPDTGRIHFNGREITGNPPHLVCKLGIGRTYQIPQPFISLSVLDNLRVSSVFGRAAQGGPQLDFDQILEMVGLLDRKEQPAGDLPILSLKKLELARALASAPRLILLDEVAAGLTDPEVEKTLDTIKQIRDLGVTILTIEHVMKVMVNSVDRIVVLDKGALLSVGTTADIMKDSKVVEAYFGA
jgi:branched-chain amino acid transport system ATP-binding protein